MIQIEDCYWGTCMFCRKPTHYRMTRETGPWHEVCPACAQSSRSAECADERHANSWKLSGRAAIRGGGV